MTQTIDPIKLKAAAEHLEWVLRQYPDEPTLQDMLNGLSSLIEDARAGRIEKPVDPIPFRYNFGDGAYRPYEDPNVDDAYVAFSIEMRGGLTEQEKRLHARIEAFQKAAREDSKS